MKITIFRSSGIDSWITNRIRKRISKFTAFTEKEIILLVENLIKIDYKLLLYLPRFLEKTEELSRIRSNDPQLKHLKYNNNEHKLFKIWLCAESSDSSSVDRFDPVFTEEGILLLAKNLIEVDYKLLRYLPRFLEKTEKLSRFKSNDPQLKGLKYTDQEYRISQIWLIFQSDSENSIWHGFVRIAAIEFIVDFIYKLLQNH